MEFAQRVHEDLVRFWRGHASRSPRGPYYSGSSGRNERDWDFSWAMLGDKPRVNRVEKSCFSLMKCR